jgi:hypothetical protein
MEDQIIRLPEIHDWTLVRLSYVLHGYVATVCAATGHARHRPGIDDGRLFLSTEIKHLDTSESRLTTRNTTYCLSDTPVSFEDWDEARYNTIWSTANYQSSRLLSRLEGIKQIPTTFSEVIRDSAFFRHHEAQRLLLSAIDTASDIDNGLGMTANTPDVSQLGALAIIAERTPSIDRAVAFAYEMRPVMLEELGGVEQGDLHPTFPPVLTLMVDGVPQVPMRLIPIAKVAGEIAAHLPATLGPWGRCAWLAMKNPNLRDYERPIEAIKNHRSEEVVQAAKVFPRMADFKYGD